MKNFIHILSAVLACASAAAAQGQNTGSSVMAALPTSAMAPPPSGLPSPPPQTGCPTVTSTREQCSTCAVPACLHLATLTQSCGCPTPVPTVYLDFPCASSCSGLWCGTSYAILSAKTCAGTTTTATTTTPGNTAATTSSFTSPSLSFPPNGTSTTARMPPPTTSATQSSPPINGGGRPRPFRFWL